MMPSNHFLAVILVAAGMAAAQEERAIRYDWSFPQGNLIADWSFEGESDQSCQYMENLEMEVDCRYPMASAPSGGHVLSVSVYIPSSSGAFTTQKTDYIRVEGEKDYTLSVQVNAWAGASSGGIHPYVEFFNEKKQFLIAIPLAAYASSVNGHEGTWVDYEGGFGVPSNAAFARISLARVEGAENCQLLFDNFMVSTSDNPAYVETRSHADALGNAEKEVLSDGVNDVVGFTTFDAQRRPLKRYAPVYGGAYRPFTGSSGTPPVFTVGVGLPGAVVPDFPTLEEAYDSLVAWAAARTAGQIGQDVFIAVAVDQSDPDVGSPPEVATVLSSDSVDVDFTVQGVFRGTQPYLDLLALLDAGPEQPAPPPAHTIPSAYDDPEEVVAAGTFGQNYPGETHFHAEAAYPNPGINTLVDQALPGAGYARTGGRTDRGGWALTAGTDLLENATPSVADIEITSSPLTGTEPEPYFYQWGRDRQGNYAVSFTDADGRLEKSALQKTGGWKTTRYEYDAFNRPYRVVSPEGKVIETFYDGRGRVSQVVDPDRGTVNSIYDDRDRLRFTRNLANGYFSAMKYDPLDRVLGVAKIADLGALTQANADNSEYPATSSLEQGSVYDELTAEAFEERTGLAPGAIGLNLAWLQNTQGHVAMAYKRNQEATAPGLTAAERLVATFYAYDGRGRLSAVFQYVGPAPSGHKWHKIGYLYDEQDRLEQRIVYQDAGTTVAHRATYRYDVRGRISKVVDETGSTSEDAAVYHYDPLNRIAGVSVYGDLDMTYGYDIQGKTVSIEGDAAGQNIFAQYLGYEGLAHPQLPGTAPTSATRFDGKISSSLLKYSRASAEQGTHPVEYRTFSYEPDGPLSETRRYQGSVLQPGSGEIDFSGLPFGTLPVQTLGYAYSEDGGFSGRSIENTTGTNASLAYAYQTGTHQLASVTRSVGSTSETSTFTYDGEGKLMAQSGPGAKTLGYDFMGMPVSIFAGGETQYYFYGPDNFRVATYTEEASTIRKKVYVYEDGLKVAKEIRDNGASVKTRVHLYGQGELLGQMDEETRQKRLLVRDHQGSVVQVVGDDGLTKDETFFADYGELAKKVDAGDVLNPSEGWTGKVFDAEVGLNYFGARNYDPMLGVWLTPDLIRESHNPYSYVGGDPINYFDPNGMERYSVQINAFIHTAIFEGPMGRTFRGDGRLAGEEGTSRLSISAVVETDPSIAPSNPLLGKVAVNQGLTKEIKTGEEARGNPKASVVSYRSSRSRDNAILKVKGSAKDPIGAPKSLRAFNPLGPGLDFEVTVQLTPGQPPVASGKIDAFPAFEVLVNNQVIYSYVPPNSNLISSVRGLYGIGAINFNSAAQPLSIGTTSVTGGYVTSNAGISTQTVGTFSGSASSNPYGVTTPSSPGGYKGPVAFPWASPFSGD